MRRGIVPAGFFRFALAAAVCFGAPRAEALQLAPPFWSAGAAVDAGWYDPLFPTLFHRRRAADCAGNCNPATPARPAEARYEMPGGRLAYSFADAATGVMRILSDQDHYFYGSVSAAYGPGVVASWTDRGVITPPAGWTRPTIPVEFLLSVEGTYTEGASVQWSFVASDSANAALTFSFAEYQGSYRGGVEDDPAAPVTESPIVGPTLRFSDSIPHYSCDGAPPWWISLSCTQFLLRAEVPVSDPVVLLRTYIGGYGRIDSSNSARTAILLPEGAVWSGASGRRVVGSGLSTAEAQVPAPAAGGLLAAALAAVAALRRQGQRRRAMSESGASRQIS